MQDLDRLIYYYNRCDPYEAIPAGDPRGFYVDFDAQGLRGDRCIDTLASTIKLSGGAPTYQLFTGFRGSGKTSELNRLIGRLDDLGHFVVYVDAAETIDVQQPIHFSDVLISLGLAVEKALDAEADRGKWGRWARRFAGEVEGLLFSHVRIKDFEAKAGLGPAEIKLGLELKGNQVFRDALRAAANDRRRQLMDQARDFFDAAQSQVSDHGWPKGLVVILDNLEKLASTPGILKSAQEMFLNSVEALRTPGFHLIYTIPIQLVFSPVGAQFGLVYEGEPRVLPMVKFNDKKTGEPYPPGRAALLEVLRRRLDFDEVFNGDESLPEMLVEQCGGFVRDLFRLAQSAITYSDQDQTEGRTGLPLERRHITQAITNLKRSYLNSYSTDYAELLKLIERDRPDHLPQELLEHLEEVVGGYFALVYRNAFNWYDVHPLIREFIDR